MAGVMLLFLLFASPIISIFTNNPEVHAYGVLSLQIIGSGYIFYGIGMVMIQALKWSRRYPYADLDQFFGFWLFQIPFAFLLAKVFKLGPWVLSLLFL